MAHAMLLQLAASLALSAAAAEPQAQSEKAEFKLGIIGLDTSHVVAFTRLINDPKAEGDLGWMKVVAAYPGGSPDIPSSADRLEGFTNTLRDDFKVEIVDSIEALLPKVDGILLESVDGRPHLEQAKPVIAAGKPLFIDKPAAGSLADVIEIFRLAEEGGVPCFSSSSLRFGEGVQKMLDNPDIGKILGCDAWSPCSLESNHPDLFWYGVHGVEILYTIMGTGCESVTRVHTDGTDMVVGRWNDGRIGSFRGIRQGRAGYGATVFGDKGIGAAGRYGGYAPLVVEIGKFFRTGKAPVSAKETVELFAFMEAADESKRQDGAPVTIKSVMDAAEKVIAERN